MLDQLRLAVPQEIQCPRIHKLEQVVLQHTDALGGGVDQLAIASLTVAKRVLIPLLNHGQRTHRQQERANQGRKISHHDLGRCVGELHRTVNADKD